MRKLLLCVLVCLVLGGTAWAGPQGEAYPETAAAAREILWKTLTSGNVNAATVAVMDGGKIIYSQGFGVANRRTGSPIEAETRFNIGSTSKMFAAAAILLLRDEGKLSLDDSVAELLPEFSMDDPKYRGITVRMLFNHSSGLPGSTFEIEYQRGEDPHELLLKTLREDNLKHAPGAMSIYCNDGFTLAEMIVEKLSGKPFPDFLQERIFDPLEMRHTGPNIGESPGNVAFYYSLPEGKEYPLEILTVYAAGGLSSTAEDLCRFADSFTPGGKHLLSPFSLKEILAAQPTPFSALFRGEELLNAFGWDYASLPSYQKLGRQVLSKSGGTSCYSTNLQVLPAERIAVAVSLSGRTSGEAITQEIMDALMRDKGLEIPAEEPVRKPVEPQKIPEELLVFEGLYVNGSSAFRLDLKQKEGLAELHKILPLSSEDQGPFKVLVHRNGTFYNNTNGQEYYFIHTKEGDFLAAHNIPLYGSDTPTLQKISEGKSPKSLGVDMHDTLWLRKNALPMSLLLEEVMLLRSSTNPELPGYVHFLNVLRVEDAALGAIAATAFRDQAALHVLSSDDGVPRVRLSIFVFSGEAAAEDLSPGTHSVVIGSEGENEWRKLSQGAILGFEKPEKGRVLLFSEKEGDVHTLYDSLLDSGEIYAPEGTFLFFAGSPGDIFSISAR